MKTSEQIVKKISETLEKQGVMRSTMAERMGISPAALSKMLRPETNPTVKTLERMARALGLHLEIIFREG